MELNETTEPTYYNSLYRHGVDEKRRVQIPAKWRPAKPGTELTLVLWPKAKEGPCLRVLPPQQMAKLMRDVDAMPNSDSNKVVLKRFIGSESVQVTLDKAGRICLPEKMARDAGISERSGAGRVARPVRDLESRALRESEGVGRDHGAGSI